MSRRRLSLAAVVLTVALLFSAVSWYAISLREPLYKGKPLSFWLVNCATARGDTGQRSEADSALSKVGTNAIPVLLRLVRAKDSTLKIQIRRLSQQLHVLAFDFVPASIKNSAGLYGFIRLGSSACDAVPDLIGAYVRSTSKSSRKAAAGALAAIGPPAASAVPVLLVGTKDPDAEVRASAVWALANIHSEPDLVLPALVKLLSDASPDVRGLAAGGLGQFGKEAASAVSALIGSLEDQNPLVRESAASSLGKLHLHADDVVPALIRRLRDPDPLACSSAVSALSTFGSAAKTAAPMLSELARTSNFVVREAAVSALNEIQSRQ